MTALDTKNTSLKPDIRLNKARHFDDIRFFEVLAFLIIALPDIALSAFLNDYGRRHLSQVLLNDFELFNELLNTLEETKQGLLLEYIDVNRVDEDQRTLLMYSVIDESHASIFPLLCKHTTNLNAQSFSGKTALHYAAEYGEVDIINALVRKGADITLTDKKKLTPLAIAIENSQSSAALLLIETSSDDNWGDEKYAPLLRNAIEKNLKDVALMLYRKAVTLELKQFKISTLHFALSRKKPKIALAFINETDIDIKSDTVGGFNALYQAIECGYKDVVLALIEKGIDIQIANPAFNDTPLLWALEQWQFDIAILLIQRGALLSLTAQTVNELLLHTIEKGLTQVALSILKENHIIPDILTTNHQTLLIRAISLNQTEVALSLIDHGCPIDKQDDNGDTALLYALSTDNKVVAKVLIEKGNAFNHPNKKGNYPLHVAIKLGLDELALAIIRRGADLRLKNREGDSPLILAIDNQQNKVALDIIEKGGVEKNESPLLYAIQARNKALALTLLEREGSALDTPSEVGDTPLIWAISEGFKDIALALIRKGANLNATNDEGDTVLIYAIAIGETQIADALIRDGADIHQTDRKGKTPLRLALEMFDTQRAKTLIEKGAKIESPNQTMNGPITLQEHLNLTALRSRLKTVLKSIERTRSLTKAHSITAPSEDEVVIPETKRAFN